MNTKQCDIDGDYHYPNISGLAVYEEPCASPVTHRWRSDQMTPNHWNYRCATHIRWLDSALPGLIIEKENA